MALARALTGVLSARRTFWFLTALCFGLSFTSCTPVTREPAATAQVRVSAVSAQTPAPLDAPVAAPRWIAPTGSSGPEQSLRVSGRYVVASGPGLSVFDAESGHLRWRHARAGNVAAVAGPAVYAADERGGVAAFTVATGGALWHVRGLCPADDGAGAVGALEATPSEVFVGCNDSGDLFRLDARSGRALAKWTFGSMNRFLTIRVLAARTVAVLLDTSGAILRGHLVFLRRTDLKQVTDDTQNSDIIGVVGSTVVAADACCHLDGPIVLSYYALTDGRFLGSRAIERTDDESGAYGGSIAIVGRRLYVSVAPDIDDYGDPLSPARRPKRSFAALTHAASFIAGRYAIADVGTAARAENLLLDLTRSPPRVDWRGGATPMVDVTAPSREVVALMDASGSAPSRGSIFLDVRTGRAFVTADSCGYGVTTQPLFVAQCSAFGAPYANVLEAFRRSPALRP